MYHGINEHRKKEIIDILSVQPMSARELAKELEIDNSRIYRLVQALIKDNQIRVAGYYEVVKGKSKVYEVCS